MSFACITFIIGFFVVALLVTEVKALGVRLQQQLDACSGILLRSAGLAVHQPLCQFLKYDTYDDALPDAAFNVITAVERFMICYSSGSDISSSLYYRIDPTSFEYPSCYQTHRLREGCVSSMLAARRCSETRRYLTSQILM